MPIKSRHRIYDLGAVNVGAFTDAIDVTEFTKGLVYIDMGVSGGIVTMQTSPDGGSNWHDAFDGDGAALAWTVTSALPFVAYGIPIVGKLIRFGVTAQNVDHIWFEGLREIG